MWCENPYLVRRRRVRRFGAEIGALLRRRRRRSAPASIGAEVRRIRRRKRRSFARTTYAFSMLMVLRAPPPAQTAARPARPPGAYGAHPAPPEPENGAPRARTTEFSSKSHHILVAPSYRYTRLHVWPRILAKIRAGTE